MDTHEAALANVGLSGISSGSLSVTFGETTVEHGQILTPSATEAPPSVSWEASEDSFYTLVCTDPDAISRSNPIFREFIHWVVVNIPGSDVASGETVAPYVGPGPPYNSGLHSYLFLVYKQASKFDAENVSEATNYFSNRGGLKAHEFFGEKKGLGVPVGARSFQAAWDESIDELHKKIGFLPPEEYRSPAQKAANP